MKRKSLFIGAVGIAVLVLALTAWPGFTAVSGQTQLREGQITIWISTVEDGELVRRLDPTASEAWVVVRSNLGTHDHKAYVVELQDATGISVFRSDTLTLPTGPYTISVPISGTLVFQGYLDFATSRKDVLVDGVDDAIRALQKERGESDPNVGGVIARIQDVLAVQRDLDAALERLQAFDNLEAAADTAFGNARADLSTVADEGDAAINALGADPIDWDGAAAHLQSMRDAAVNATTNVDHGIGAVDRDLVRHFPPTSISGRCSQNQVVLLAELRDPRSGSVTYSPATDSWWTVGTPGTPVRLTNPQQPTETGALQAEIGQLYTTDVQISGTVTTTTPIHALVLDEACVPVEGATVHFAVATEDAAQATLSAEQVTTDANGEATVELSTTDTLGDGTVQVTATVDSASASATVNVVGPPASVEFQGGLVSQSNFGVNDIVQVSVVVRDANGRNVIDGTEVEFSIDPPEHRFGDGVVTTDNGRAVTTLLFGSSTGPYTIRAQAGGAGGPVRERVIRVVNPPQRISVRAVDRDTGAPINTIFVQSPKRFAEIRVNVWSEVEEETPAPDATVVEFDFADAEDWCWAGFSAPSPDSQGRYRTTLANGRATATLVANETSNPRREGCPANAHVAFERLQLRVTATYQPSEGSPIVREQTIPIDLRGYTVFLPLVSHD